MKAFFDTLPSLLTFAGIFCLGLIGYGRFWGNSVSKAECQANRDKCNSRVDIRELRVDIKELRKEFTEFSQTSGRIEGHLQILTQNRDK